MDDGPPHCYAVRRLNPVLGMVQVLAIEGARALSHDGRLWELQVLAERPDHTWRSDNQGSAIKQFFRFGNWHPQQGLSRVPANPLLDLGAMQAAVDRLLSALQEKLDALPFPQQDHYECWLLDRERQPLALLASTTASGLVSEIRPDRWCASLNGEHGFVSQTLLGRDIPRHDGHNPRRHAHEVETLVRKTGSGERCWFLCDEQGHRHAMAAGGPAIEPAAFPALGLRENWKQLWQQDLVGDYLDWLSPRLLTWQGLDRQQRDRLEQVACRHALALERHFPLYPEVINPGLLEQARVEARLRRSNAAV